MSLNEGLSFHQQFLRKIDISVKESRRYIRTFAIVYTTIEELQIYNSVRDFAIIKKKQVSEL